MAEEDIYTIIAKIDGVEAVESGLSRIKAAAESATKSATADIRAQGAELKKLTEDYEKLQKEMKAARDVSSVGKSGMEVFKEGLKSASNLEASLTQLRLSIQRLGADGTLNVGLLNEQMEELEKLGDKLGGTLPGATKDFIDMFIALRQGGMGVTEILDGAGAAVANLAAAAGETPADLAKSYAQLGPLFNLKPEDYATSADLLARISRTTGQKPSSLLESAKSFAPGTGLPKGLTGMAGLTASTELLSVLKRFGQEGQLGGREMAALFGRLGFDSGPQRKALAQLHKQGIDLQFFDKKGNFAGLENFFEQIDKLQKLSPKKREGVSRTLFGDDNKHAVEALTRIGGQGFKNFEGEVQSQLPLAEQVKAVVSDIKVQWENVQDAAERVAAKGFKPLLEHLKPLLDLSQRVLGGVEQFVSQHETFTKFASGLLGLGSAAALVVGGVNAGRTAIGLYSVAAKIASGETSLLGAQAATTATEVGAAAVKVETAAAEMEAAVAEAGAAGALTKAEAEARLFGTGSAARAAATEVKEVAVQAETAASKVAFYKRSLGTVPSMIATTIALYGIDMFMQYIDKLEKEKDQALQDYADTQAESNKVAGRFFAARQISVETTAQYTKTEAFDDLKSFLINTRKDIAPWYASFIPTIAAGGVPLSYTDQGDLQERMIKNLPKLEWSSYFASFMKSLETSGLKADERAMLEKGARAKFPAAASAYDEAMKKYNGSWKEVLESLTVSDKKKAAEDKAINGMDKLGTSATAASGRIDKMAAGKDNNQGGQGGKGKRGVVYQSKASGGDVLSGGAVVVHPGEMIMPARVTSEYKRAGGGGVHLTYSPVVNVTGGGSPDEERRFLALLGRHVSHIEQMLDSRYKDIRLGV